MKKYIIGLIALLLLAGCAVRKNGYGPPPPDAIDYYSDRPGYYYYYPSTDVYYDLAADRYFYLMNGNWIYSGSLPPYYYDRLGRFVRVYVPNGYPYYHVREHSREYTRPRRRNGQDEPRPRQDSGNRPRPRDDAKPESRPRERPREQPESRPESKPQSRPESQPRDNNDNNRPRPR